MAILVKRTWRKIIRRSKNLSAIGVIVAALLAAGEAPAPAQNVPAPEYQVKAIFLFNFAEFVDWPTNAFPTADSPLVIGVLGVDPFGVHLDATVRDEKINGRPLLVQR